MSDRGFEAEAEEPARRSIGLLLLPLAFFGFIAIAFFFALQSGDPSKLPSTLIGKQVPAFRLPAVDGLRAGGAPMPGFGSDDLKAGKVTVMNVWASWCAPCRAEHPLVTAIAKDLDVPVYGLNSKDKPGDARWFLGRYGNPYTAVGADASGRSMIEWGVYGVPETFVIDRQGRVAHRHVGPITAKDYEQTIKPLIQRLRQAPAAG